MKSLVLLFVVAFAVGAYAQCSCDTMKWATCDGTPCECFLMVGNGERQVLNCTTLIPKCFLMKAEMYRARKGLSTRSIDGKPTETAFVDNDGIYDPECESNGVFKAKQCNNTEECWCVNSAGVRRTDKGDKDLKCEELVETHWLRLELKHKETTDAVDPLNLGAVDTYGNILRFRRPFAHGEDGDKYYVEADHIPPLQSFCMARWMRAFSSLRRSNRKLHELVMSLESDPRGKKLPTVQVPTHHHQD